MEPKYIVQEYVSRVRSQLVYGSEFLSMAARALFIEVDQNLTRLFLTRLIHLGDRALAKKHQLRQQLELRLATYEMETDELVRNMIRTWIHRRTSCNPHISVRTKDSLFDIMNLE